MLCIAAAPVCAIDTPSAVQYLKAGQYEDGGFSEPGEGSNLQTTCWSILGVLAAGEEPGVLVKNGASPVDYLNAHARDISEIDDYELFLLSYSEAGGDPHNVSGLDMVSIVKFFEGKDGRIGNNVSQHCMGVLSLVSAGEETSSGWGEWIVQNQRSDGGWGESDAISDTALAVEALVALGEADNEIIEPAIDYLRREMNGDGGFSRADGGSDTQTTSCVIRAINAIGDDPASEFWSFQGNSPSGFMNSAQKTDGHFSYNGNVDSEPTLTTGMALPSIEGKHFPFGATDMGTQVQKVVDLGTLGAGLKKNASGESGWIGEADAAQEELKVSRDSSLGRVSAGYIGEKESQLNNLWFLMIIIVLYLIVLAVVGAAVRVTVRQ